MTRFEGGAAGPVILSPGLGVSSLIFTIDTIRTNLVEYLCGHGYDVWLLDHRASIDMQASNRPYTADDLATRDYPAAVERVRQITGADTVQIVGHCFGGTTFLMAILAGLEGVRSAVVSQASLHMIPPRSARLLAGARLPSVLMSMGIEAMTAKVERDADWQSRLVDTVLRFTPVEFEEWCRSPTCRRVTFLYGHLYEHDQLNTATHDNLHELFGIAQFSALKQLATITRNGTLVDALGKDVYMPNLERLALPITFIHGEENICFLPEGSERTMRMLAEAHGSEMYERILIPDYGHIDCIFGRDAATDVYPHILASLSRHPS